MNRSAIDCGFAALVVSQFTLAADGRAGRRPSFDAAAPPEVAEPLYERFVASAARVGPHGRDRPLRRADAGRARQRRAGHLRARGAAGGGADRAGLRRVTSSCLTRGYCASILAPRLDGRGRQLPPTGPRHEPSARRPSPRRSWSTGSPSRPLARRKVVVKDDPPALPGRDHRGARRGATASSSASSGCSRCASAPPAAPRTRARSRRSTSRPSASSSSRSGA